MDNQTAHAQILKLYELQADEAEDAYRWARKYQTPSTAAAKRKDWDKAREILFAVDTALAFYRERTEKESAK
jgi:hypothetical protein